MSLPVIAIYPGRFQPMGIHHKLTFDWVVNTFGYDNSFIATSGKVELPKSPLNFHEKQSIVIAHGISPDKFILTRSPYVPIEAIKMLETQRGLFLQDFSIVFVVGKKDMDDNPRFTPGYKKDGSPSYFQYYDQSSPMASADTHGYLVVAPHSCIRLPDNSECSGTNLRSYLSNANPQEFQAVMGFYDESIYSLFRKKFLSSMINERILTESEKDRSDLILGTPEYEEYVAELIRDIQHVKKSLRSRTKKGSKHRKEAARLQNAIDSLKFMGRKNQRAILDNNRIDERVINVAAPEEPAWNNRTTQKEDLTRDEIKSYFYRIKR
jgi:hypothetical protein